jgi:hypothetical protein
MHCSVVQQPGLLVFPPLLLQLLQGAAPGRLLWLLSQTARCHRGRHRCCLQGPAAPAAGRWQSSTLGWPARKHTQQQQHNQQRSTAQELRLGLSLFRAELQRRRCAQGELAVLTSLRAAAVMSDIS